MISDGVLNTTKTIRMCCGFHFVDTRKVLRLREIVERTGAVLVMSSSWRYGATNNCAWYETIGYNELQEEFKRLRCPLWIDTTPCMPGVKRQKEIFAWLTAHPEVDEFIILDDVGQELTWYWDRLVLTDPRVGLNKERMELAIKMLGEVENE